MNILQNSESIREESSSSDYIRGRTKTSKLVKIIIILIVFSGVAFVIYGVIYVFDFFPFNITTKATQSDWFSFMGSYLGAWGTVVLGYIAYIQNKEYKKLSDETDKRAEELQLEIKKLT